MKRVKYFLKPLGWAVILWLLVGKITVMAAPVGSWSDSLRVDIVDSTVLQIGSSKYLQFSLIVQRVNADWNMPDTALGNCDFYFYANLEAFTGVPVFTYVHDSLNAGSGTGVGGHPDAILQANVGIWAERLHISLTRQDTGQGNAILGVVPKNTAKYKLQLTVGKVDTLCTVRWKLREPLAVNLGIIWDTGRRGATGLQTYGGNPILDTLFGDIEKIPSDLLDVDCMEGNYYACEGSPLSVGLHAETTGEGLVFEWYDSIPGGGQAFPIVATAHTQDRTPALSGKNYKYDYGFSAQGDTLYIDQVPASIDSIYFYCLVKDTTLASHPAQWCKTQLFVRDSIKGFISPLTDDLTINYVDTVTKCEGQEGVAVRFNFFGVTEQEFLDIDSVYFVYWVEREDGGLMADTVAVSTRNVYDSPNQINGETVYYMQANIKGAGKVFINKMWTRYCDNAVAATAYDTLYVKEDRLQMLPKLIVSSKETITTDDIGSTVFVPGSTSTAWPDEVNSLRGLGTIELGQRFPIKYIAKDTTGLDTMKYIMPGGQCAYMREIEVQELKYLTLKVYLWGAWRGSSNSMLAFMGSTNLRNYANMKDPFGAYYVSPYHPNCKIPVNRLQEIIQMRTAAGELGFVDWVEVDLVKATTNSNVAKPFIVQQKVDSVSAFLRADGIVCDTAGNPYITFKNLSENDYYVIVKHRNHLGIMSGEKISLSTTIPASVMLDFTSTITSIAGSVNIAYYKPTTVNNIFMYVGNVDGNDKISVADMNKVSTGYNTNPNYYIEDLDFNQRVNMSDINFWMESVSSVPTEAFR